MLINTVVLAVGDYRQLIEERLLAIEDARELKARNKELIEELDDSNCKIGNYEEKIKALEESLKVAEEDATRWFRRWSDDTDSGKITAKIVEEKA